MRGKSSLTVVKLLVLAMLVPLLPGSLAGPGGPPKSEKPADPVRDVLTLPAGEAIADVVAKPLGLDRLLRSKVSGIRIAVVSSGVDLSVLPQPLRGQIANASQDHVGYGTYVTSVLLQLAPDARITSLDAYPQKAFDPKAHAAALNWAAAHDSELDAVLYAVPPHEFLDPVSSAMATGTWKAVADALSDSPLQTDRGALFGVAMDPALRAKQARGLERKVLDGFAAKVNTWNAAAAQVAKLAKAGVAVVAPAGDLGPAVQTILGFANMPEVVTVGGANRDAISAKTSSGPSVDGRVKPDLVAPTNIVGLLPETSTLAKSLERSLDPTLEPLWTGREALTKARASLDTSLTSAAVVSLAVGGLAAEGVRDVARQRGALTAASVPVRGAAAWRQGAGLLRTLPDKAFASSRPLALGHADLGVEPDGGTWSTVVPFVQGAPTAIKTTISSFAGVGPDAKTYTRGVDASEAPPVSATPSNDGVEITLPAGDGTYEGGVFCGYSEVSVPLTSGDVKPGVTVDGVPQGVEQLPTCLVKGSRLQAHGFYIHDMPAEDLTFALLPALPEEASILQKPLMILPVNPLHTKLYFKSTGKDGNAWLNNVVPGYYSIRLFSDYGAPITQTLVSSTLGTDLLKAGELGENPSYLTLGNALVLSATGWTRKDLEDRFGADNVQDEKPTGAYLVKIGPRTMRVVLGFLKDKPGAGVTSRYIDLMSYDDLNFSSLPLSDILRAPDVGVGGDLMGWTFRKAAEDAEAVVAQLNPLAAVGAEKDTLGVGTYPFSLTTPNYKGHMSLNFSYEVDNAFIVAMLKVGDEVAAGVVTPWGTVRTPTVGPFTPIGSSGVGLSNQASGLANFEFDFLPRGADRGVLTFVFVPSRPVQQAAAPLATARIGDLSFAMDTWQRVQWPGLMTPHGMGHLFSVDPNYSAKQMSSAACRAIDSGGVKADVCEDWRVMVHSPGDDASTVELVDAKGSVNPSLIARGGTYADPKRGSSDFSALLAFAMPARGGLDALVKSLPLDMKTNGRFWEQLVLTKDTLAEHPDEIEVQIVDNVPGRQSTLVPHVLGGAPVSPYVPFANQSVPLDGESLSVTDADKDGVPQVSFTVHVSNAVDWLDQTVTVGDPDDEDASVPGSSLDVPLSASVTSAALPARVQEVTGATPVASRAVGPVTSPVAAVTRTVRVPLSVPKLKPQAKKR